MAKRDPYPVLNTMIHRSLRPIVRVALRHSIKLLNVLEILKVVLVEVAKEELAKSGDSVSASRISVMTGVHRKDVTRIIKEKGAVKEAPNLISRVIGQWRHDPRFCTNAGTPKVLTAEGLESEFVQLVQSISGDVAPYTVLYEMERLEMVERTSKGLKLKSQLFVLRDTNTIEGFQMLGEDLEDLGSAVIANLTTDSESRNLHLKTEYNAIAEEHLPEIRRWLLEHGTRFHKETEKYLSQFDSDINPKNRRGSVRVAVGSFSYSDMKMESKEQ